MIDLDALLESLLVAGLDVEVEAVPEGDEPTWIEVMSTPSFVVHDDGLVDYGDVEGCFNAEAWSALDIIRRHVEPRPADDLRGRVRAAVDANLHAGRGSEVDKITDAVLAVINEDGPLR